MQDARNDFQAALVRFSKAEAAAKEMYALLSAVGSALRSDLASFMGWHCGVTLHHQMPRGGRFNPDYKVGMGQWPDAERLKAVLVEWAESRDRLEAAWQAMTPAQQIGFSEPTRNLRIV